MNARKDTPSTALTPPSQPEAGGTMNEREDTQSTALTPPSQSPSLTLREVIEGEDTEWGEIPLFLEPAKKDPKGVFITPFSYIANAFKMGGLESFRLKVAMVMWLALNSAHLDNPFTVEIIDAPDCGAAKPSGYSQKSNLPGLLQNLRQA